MSSIRLAPPMRQLLLVWLVLSVIATPLVVIFLGPQLPPGAASDAAHGQQQDNTVMTAIVTPIILALLIYFAYALYVFKHRGRGNAPDGPPMRGDASVIALWIGVTFTIVIFLATWGSYELWPGEAGAGGGQGPAPVSVATPPDASTALPVQVIGQQWAWTFRYPTYGGLETTELVLPVNRQIRFIVTSIDVIHSFWALKLGVKADAVPNTSNIAFAKPVKVESSTIRCAELCGLWHGNMYTPLHVVTATRFLAWIAEQRSRWSLIGKYLPPFATKYAPEPKYRAE